MIKGRAEWGTQKFLAALLQREFEAVEAFSDQLDFVRGAEKHWPCSWTAKGRERIEADQQRRTDWERRRVVYIVNRERAGIKGDQAHIEFLNKVRPT